MVRSGGTSLNGLAAPGPRKPGRSLPLLLSFPLLLLATGCNTLAPLPVVDLTQGWTIRQGQAVWKTGEEGPELAGEVLLATRAPDKTFVQFTKAPFPMLVAQTTGATWEARIPMRNQRFSGRGQPPKRLIWLYLPKAMAGHPLPRQFTWEERGGNWRLENAARSEYIEGYFAP